MKIYEDITQGTDEWLRIRMGKFTASNFGKLFMAKSTKGYNDLINTVVFERVTDELPESFSNEWTERGKELEPDAIEAYQLLTFSKVKRVGFVERDEWVGCSPDGLIGERGMIQVKCPKHTTLIDYVLDESIPKDYLYQIQGELMVSERDWSDFFVYHPKMKPLLRRVPREEKIIRDIQAKLDEAISTAKERIIQIAGGE